MRLKQIRSARKKTSIAPIVADSSDDNNNHIGAKEETTDHIEDKKENHINKDSIDHQMDAEDSVPEVDIKDDKPLVTDIKISSDSDILKELKTKITENDKYFSSLIDLIPAKIYFDGNEEILQAMETQKRNHLGDNVNLSAKSKQKRFRLDPTSGNKKISEIANNFYNKKKNGSNDKMSELRHKLNEKISQLKARRGQKLNAKQLRESKKERKKLNSMRASKQKGFSKKQNSVQNESESEPKAKKVKLDEHQNSQTSGPNLDKIPKIYNKEGNIVFSKFDFISSNTAVEDKKKKKLNKKNKLQNLLVKTKKEEKKLSELEVTNAPKAKEIKDKKRWRTAIDKSEGIKVKDKSNLIEKALKKQKKMKQKSGKKWKERNETIENNKQKKQQKRQKNLQKRKDQKKDKKIKHLKKKGRYVDNN